MIRIAVPFDKTPSHGQHHGPFGFGPLPHPHHHPMFMGPHGRRAQGPPCSGPFGPGDRHFRRPVQPCRQYQQGPAPHSPPRGPPYGSHSPVIPHGWQHGPPAQQQRGPPCSMVDHKLAFVDYKLDQNEQAATQLRAQLGALLSEQQQLKQQKRCMEKERVKEHRRQVAAWKKRQTAHMPKEAPARQATPKAAAAQVITQSKPMHLIQGTDGRMYCVVAAVEDSSSRKQESTKVECQNVGKELKQGKLPTEEQCAKEHCRKRVEESRRCFDSWKQLQAELEADQAEQKSNSIHLIAGPSRGVCHVVSSAAEGPAGQKQPPKEEYKQKNDDRHDTTEGDISLSKKHELMVVPVDTEAAEGASRTEKVTELERKEEPHSVAANQVDTHKAQHNGDAPADSAQHETAFGTGASRPKEVEVVQVETGNNKKDTTLKMVPDGVGDSSRGQLLDTDKVESKKSTMGKEIVKRWILEGVPECTSKRSTADEIQRIVGSILCQKPAANIEEKKNSEGKFTESVKTDASEDVKKDKTVDTPSGENCNISNDMNNRNSEVKAEVEAVSEEEWEEVAHKPLASAGSSVSSSLTPRTSEGESWMEPIDGDTTTNVANTTVSERSSSCFELV